MNSVEALLVVFDGAWKDDYESLADACTDLTEEESAWQPPAYAHEPHDDDGTPGTVMWHLTHLEMCHRHYIDTLRNTGPSHDTGELPLKQVLAKLGDTTQELRNAINQLMPEDLTRQVRPNRSTANFIAMIARHMSWHAGMIKQTRRLFRHR